MFSDTKFVHEKLMHGCTMFQKAMLVDGDLGVNGHHVAVHVWVEPETDIDFVTPPLQDMVQNFVRLVGPMYNDIQNCI